MRSFNFFWDGNPGFLFFFHSSRLSWADNLLFPYSSDNTSLSYLLHFSLSTVCINDLGKLNSVCRCSGFKAWANFCDLHSRPNKNVTHFKSDTKIIISLLLPRLSLNPWYTRYMLQRLQNKEMSVINENKGRIMLTLN